MGKLTVVRIGSPAKVQPWLVATTLRAQVALTAPGKRAASLRVEARTGTLTGRRRFEIRKLAFSLEQAAAELIIYRADVVCATCVGAGDRLLEGVMFRVACVDEATQCTEPAALIPLSKALSGVLVGDARQLPPTVISPKAVDAGLRCSLFERL
jgi:regulator of nonsense transcripts 1